MTEQELQQQAIERTITMFQSLVSVDTINLDALITALAEHLQIEAVLYGVHDTTDNKTAVALREQGDIAIERHTDYDFVNIPVYGVYGILVSHHDDGHLWSLGLDDGRVVYW